MEYQSLQPLFCGEDIALSQLPPQEHVLVVSGIANPTPLLKEIGKYCGHVRHLSYPDHHHFSPGDIADIQAAFDALPQPRCIITTEKDAVRLTATKMLSDEARHHIYQLPIRVRMPRWWFLICFRTSFIGCLDQRPWCAMTSVRNW